MNRCTYANKFSGLGAGECFDFASSQSSHCFDFATSQLSGYNSGSASHTALARTSLSILLPQLCEIIPEVNNTWRSESSRHHMNSAGSVNRCSYAEKASGMGAAECFDFASSQLSGFNSGSAYHTALARRGLSTLLPQLYGIIPGVDNMDLVM